MIWMRTSTNRAVVVGMNAIAATAVVVLAASCSSGSKGGRGASNQQGSSPRSPVTTTVVNFQPVGAGRAAINGDFILTDPEVQKVIQALRAGNIDIVELHNHGLTEQPRLFYLHFWGVDDGVILAKALRPALDATNLQPA